MPTHQQPEVDFTESLYTICGAGDPRVRAGVAVHVYLCNSSMQDKAFYNSDGDFLIGEKRRVKLSVNTSRQIILYHP